MNIQLLRRTQNENLTDSYVRQHRLNKIRGMRLFCEWNLIQMLQLLSVWQESVYTAL